MKPEYDTSPPPRHVQPNSSPANMTYDPGPHPPRDGASGPILWVIDPLGNRVELTPPTPTPPPEGDQPIVVNRSG